MGGGERTYRPRARTTRSLDEPRSSNSPPAQPIPTPVERDGFWFLPDPVAQRLHQKSALGLRVSDGILLTAEEVMFCHWYRHVPLPSDKQWFSMQLQKDAMLLRKTIAMDVMRNGGERVVPASHLSKRLASIPDQTWAIRWERHETWTQHRGFSQIRLQQTHDPLDWDELLAWVSKVDSDGHVAELCVIDDEFDCTIYHLSECRPVGNHLSVERLDSGTRKRLEEACQQSVRIGDGYFLSETGEWPLPSIGIPHFSGRYLRREEHQFLTAPNSNNLYATLVGQGLLLRPGFKYGCKWRAYEMDIDQAHAPWLIQPMNDAPTNWEEVCLAIRLAEGVNKRWLCAFERDEDFSFLNIKRIG